MSRLDVHQTTPDGSFRVALSSTGNILYIPQRMYDIACDMDITLFPFDQHRCSIKYGSWAFEDSKLKVMLPPEPLFIDSFVENQKWRLFNTTVSIEATEYYCQNFTETCNYTSVIFEFAVQRRVGFFTFVLLLPATLLYLLTLVTFCLPPDHSDKMQIGTLMTSIESKLQCIKI